jgi:hypothetical protein
MKCEPAPPEGFFALFQAPQRTGIAYRQRIAAPFMPLVEMAFGFFSCHDASELTGKNHDGPFQGARDR